MFFLHFDLYVQSGKLEWPNASILVLFLAALQIWHWGIREGDNGDGISHEITIVHGFPLILVAAAVLLFAANCIN